jgi:hypothetical protein
VTPAAGSCDARPLVAEPWGIVSARRRRARWAAIVAAAGLVPVLSGCVGISSISSLEQIDVIGDKPIQFTACASGSPGCKGFGFSGAPAVTGRGQILVGAQVPRNTRLPASLTSSVTFSESPSYAAELQRLSPAPAGATWRGFISLPINYDAMSSAQSFTVRLLYALQRAPDGAPYTGPFETTYVVGGRTVTATAPPERPVSCGPSLRTLYDDDPSPTTDAWNICEDSGGSSSSSTLRDLGILSGASATAAQGGLATMPFTVRYVGAPTSQATFRLSASSTLPGALFAVTPATIVPLPGVTTTVAQVGIGVPAGARPGGYDVTLTAVVNGQVRTSEGTLRVVAAPSGAAAGTGGAAARLRLTTVLPRRLSVAAARLNGIVVLIGADQAGVARVQLFQGRAKRPKAGKSVRLKVPGPVRVVLKSAKLRKGPYRIVIRADARTFVRRGVLIK